jgi:hypothetical protein
VTGGDEDAFQPSPAQLLALRLHRVRAGVQPGKAVDPIFWLVVRASAPVASLRTTTTAPSTGMECRSVSLPVIDPFAPLVPLSADCADKAVPTPTSMTSAAAANGQVQLRLASAIERPSRQTVGKRQACLQTAQPALPAGSGGAEFGLLAARIAQKGTNQRFYARFGKLKRRYLGFFLTSEQ